MHILQTAEHNNEISPQPSASYVLANSDQPASPTTLSDKSPPDSPQSSTSVFRVGLVDLPTTDWGSHCSQGVHMMQ